MTTTSGTPSERSALSSGSPTSIARLLLGELEDRDVAQHLRVVVRVELQRAGALGPDEALAVERDAPVASELGQCLGREVRASQRPDVHPVRPLEPVQVGRASRDRRAPRRPSRAGRPRSGTRTPQSRSRRARAPAGRAGRVGSAASRGRNRRTSPRRAPAGRARAARAPRGRARRRPGAAPRQRGRARGSRRLRAAARSESIHAASIVRLKATAKLGSEAVSRACPGFRCSTRSVHQLGPCGESHW